MHTQHRTTQLINAIEHTERINSQGLNAIHTPILVTARAGNGVSTFVSDFVQHSPHPAVQVRGSMLHDISEIDWDTITTQDAQTLGAYLVIDEYDVLSERVKTELANILTQREYNGKALGMSLSVIFIGIRQPLVDYVHPLDLKTHAIHF